MEKVKGLDSQTLDKINTSILNSGLIGVVSQHDTRVKKGRVYKNQRSS